MRRIIVLAILLPFLAGCVSPPPGPAELAGPEGARMSQVVVAVVDTGINPWHEQFRGSGQPPVLATAIPPSFRERTAADPEVWKELQQDTLYWFEGTRVLAISRTSDSDAPRPELQPLAPNDPHPIYDDVGHGTMVAAVVARASPHAWILMVETRQIVAPAYQWAAEQEWIDVISTSWSTLGHAPDDPRSDDRHAVAALQTWDAGRLFITSGGNTPDPNLIGGESGPPWVISVGGVESDRRGVHFMTSQPVDVVADFSWADLASAESDNGTRDPAGTSFSTPHVAGVLAEAIYQLRTEAGHRGPMRNGALVDAGGLRVTNVDLRRALNLTAAYWDTMEYDPTNINQSRLPLGAPYQVTNPALPRIPGTSVGPWVQMGWGYVGPDAAQPMIDLLLGRTTAPEKPEATAYMECMHDARAAAWAARQRDEPAAPARC